MSIDITTLALAKEYTNRMVGSGGTGGGVNGKDGITPHIGDNGNWFIGTVDTGISAQGPAGENGVTPHIGTNGNWYIGSVNTGVSAKGAKGDNGLDGNGIKSAILNSDYTLTLTFDDGTTYTTPSIRGATGSSGKDGPAGAAGKDGTDGVGIASIEQTATSTADGGNNVFTVTLTNGTTATFTVKNGSKGSTGKDGSNGVDGGHYTPVVTQPTTDTMQISFAPSKPDMPAVNTVTVNLPVSENSGQNVSQGGALTERAKTLLVTILRNASYVSNQDPNIDLLEEELAKSGSAGGGNTTCMIVLSLRNVEISNPATTVDSGAAYTATITAAEGYKLIDTSVSIAMGGIDVTESVYADGVITIPSVYADVTISAAAEAATEIIGFDLTNASPADYSINLVSNGLSVSGDITADENGWTIPVGAAVGFYHVLNAGEALEVEFGEISLTSASKNNRLLAGNWWGATSTDWHNSGWGIVWQGGAGWNVFGKVPGADTGWETVYSDDATFWSNHTIRIVPNEDNTVKIYRDGVLVTQTAVTLGVNTWVLGSSSTGINAVVKRISLLEVA